jgi:hypothetical protein
MLSLRDEKEEEQEEMGVKRPDARNVKLDRD